MFKYENQTALFDISGKTVWLLESDRATFIDFPGSQIISVCAANGAVYLKCGKETYKLARV